MTRFNFDPYTNKELREIVESRLESAKATELFKEDALKLATATVANVSGDARRVLDICRSVPSKVWVDESN
jgi:origin recognition complex subunit 1